MASRTPRTPWTCSQSTRSHVTASSSATAIQSPDSPRAPPPEDARAERRRGGPHAAGPASCLLSRLLRRAFPCRTRTAPFYRRWRPSCVRGRVSRWPGLLARLSSEPTRDVKGCSEETGEAVLRVRAPDGACARVHARCATSPAETGYRGVRRRTPSAAEPCPTDRRGETSAQRARRRPSPVAYG